MSSVLIYFVDITCIQTTREPSIPLLGSNTRDEVYMEIVERSPQGNPVKKLPADDDYYEFWKRHTANEYLQKPWTNKDQRDVGYPQIWAGTLQRDQEVNCLITLREQDNADLGEIRQIVSKSASQIANSTQDPEIKATAKAAEFLAGLLPEDNQHELIGAVAATVKNNGPEGLDFTVVPLGELNLISGQKGTTVMDTSNPYVTQGEWRVYDRSVFGAAGVMFNAPGRGVYQGIIAARTIG